MDDSNDNNDWSEKTPILLHPARREALLARGQALFNDDHHFEAHEAWEELWHLEQGRDRVFVQGLIQAAAHFHHLNRGNWSGARTTALGALEKFRFPPSNKAYKALDIVPIQSGLDYNIRLLLDVLSEAARHQPPPVPEAFLRPKLF